MANNSERVLTQLIRAAFPFDGDAIGMPQVNADEWIAIAQTAQQHNLAPLFYAALWRYDGAPEPPGALVESLQTAYHQTKIANWVAFREVGELLAIFEREKIPAVLLKGAALANTLYPNIAMRPMGDMDILIHRDDAPRVSDILTARGFTTTLEPTENFYTRFSYDQAFERVGKYPLMIEMHWHLFNLPYYRERIAIEWFWQRTLPMRVNDQPARVFAPEAQIIHLAAHAVLHHQGHGLLAAYDLALVLARYREQINWDDVIESARAFGLSRIVQSNLARVGDTWGVSVPNEVRARLARSASVRERILFAINTAPRVEARDVWDGMNLPSGKSRWLYFWHTFFPSREYMRQRYAITDARTLPLHYLRRLGRGAGMFAQSAAAMAGNVVKVLGRT
ncbi:MAG: nucleotidyltransferase family protein [Chloroflexi bacterium]|nr:nucleotidyltransferase family protein [Chloroflexota bacterium]